MKGTCCVDIAVVESCCVNFGAKETCLSTCFRTSVPQVSGLWSPSSGQPHIITILRGLWVHHGPSLRVLSALCHDHERFMLRASKAEAYKRTRKWCCADSWYSQIAQVFTFVYHDLYCCDKYHTTFLSFRSCTDWLGMREMYCASISTPAQLGSIFRSTACESCTYHAMVDGALVLCGCNMLRDKQISKYPCGSL